MPIDPLPSLVKDAAQDQWRHLEVAGNTHDGCKSSSTSIGRGACRHRSHSGRDQEGRCERTRFNAGGLVGNALENLIVVFLIGLSPAATFIHRATPPRKVLKQ